MSAHQVLDHVDQYLQLGREYECSDVHLPTAFPPAWRRFGKLAPIWTDHQPLTPADTERLARSFLGDVEWDRLQKKGDIDFAYSAANGRYRASVVKQTPSVTMKAFSTAVNTAGIRIRWRKTTAMRLSTTSLTATSAALRPA